ncbi:DUF418 domain-containing protein [Nonomuraea sp. NPDC059194]|uniref:DUF418 domain-containing protein n=1 Tax=Nonomuraea sp. NPDC059194 TaxID=3346764 RepID=UPI00369621BE
MTRIRELDALRGFAVCGIMLVNTWQHTEGPKNEWWVETFLQGRFYPIFSLLFGISFALVLESASRWVLLRRLLWLLVFGLIQRTWYPGEVLTYYAVFGIGVLLPVSFLSGGWPILVLGVAALAWGVWVGGGILIIPGLFLIGMALMELRPGRRWLLPGLVVSAAVSAVLTWIYPMTGQWWIYVTAGLAGAAAYSLLVLWARPRWLEPMGKMALTNYVSGTVVIALTAPMRWPVLAVAGATLVAQLLFSWWWLSRFRYGPLEWVWRMLTWWKRVENRPILRS